MTFDVRDRRQITALLEGLEPVRPGLVDIGSWPSGESDEDPVGIYGAVARVK